MENVTLVTPVTHTNPAAPFDSTSALRAMANTMAVRFVSAAERAFLLERAGRATFTDWCDGFNGDPVGEDDAGDPVGEVDTMDGRVEMSVHQRAQLYGAIWAIFNTAAVEQADSRYDLPMKLSDALSLITFGKVIDRADHKREAQEALKTLIERAKKEAAENAKLLVDEGDLSEEEAALAPQVAAQEATAEFNRRMADFDAVLAYVNEVPVSVYADYTQLADLLGQFDAEEVTAFWQRTHEKLLEAKDKLVARLLSGKTPATAKQNMRADLVLLRDDIKYVEQLLKSRGAI